MNSSLNKRCSVEFCAGRELIQQSVEITRAEIATEMWRGKDEESLERKRRRLDILEGLLCQSD
jgi:hypothetical protein